ncbi:PVC-type heme-binding CxxCH protein [Prosthecobacter sp.]|uniref:PVC-type heme-binding CxxCH protein n=1 Tax=Prosthecobacter sp. TaxID=1965333 RepID=UPI003782D858
MKCPKIAWLVLTLAAPLVAEELKFPTTPPTEPQNAAKTFHVLDGFEMQLIAAEPLVTDPVAITYDEDGRAYVCEMNDYPYTDKEHHKHAQENPTDQAIGKVRLLTDSDGDGVFDKATVFAEGLSWPTGAACWKGGIFVTATPDVWYLKDTNGDGVADVRQKVFTGFKKLNVQAVMNNPIWGLDHRIYVAGGSNGGEIQRVPGSESVMPLPADFKPLPIKRNDFSFDPSTGDVRLESGGARFGNTFDDWGNRFLCNIRNPCQHVVLPYRYLARNPYLVVPSALNDCAEAGDQLPVYRTSPAEPWREFRAKRWVQEGSTLPKSELVGAGVVTSSAGITVYRGDAYPPEYRDFAFVADVAGNLFYRMKLVPDGVTFKAVQVDGTKNFCTSDDLWFRPVNFVNAPDGCLHVCDMYREVIEHPWSIPDDIHSAVDLLRGRDKGRVFRLAPKSFKSRATPKMSKASTGELVALLDHPNAWHRETAQRLLFERQDKAAVSPMSKLVESAKTPQGKVSTLWTLGMVTKDLAAMQGAINAAAVDQNPQVRANAARFACEWQDTSPPSPIEFKLRLQSDQNPSRPDLLAALSSSAMEPATVAFWAAFHAGNLDDKNALRRMSALQWRHGGDTWMQPALLSYRDSPTSNGYLVGNLVGRLQKEQMAAHPLLAELARRMGIPLSPAEGVAVTQEILSTAMPEAVKRHMLENILRGMQFRGTNTNEVITHPAVAQACHPWIEKARADLNSGDAVRIKDALSTLAVFETAENFTQRIQPLMLPSNPAEVQLMVLEALGTSRDPAVADILLTAWPKLTPALREKATTLLLSRTDRIAKLLDAIEAKKILPSQLSVAAKATLGRQKTPALVARITKLIGDGSSSNRKAVIDKYTVAMSGSDVGTPARITGDPVSGAKVYETLCMVCHRHVDRGNDVGPNLGTIKAWTAEQILTNVLDPNREVSPNFALYIVETNDGRTLSGLIASETAGNLTLKRADGGTDTVLRSEIKSLTSPGISLMPEGLEAAITPQQMADLIEYLKK